MSDSNSDSSNTTQTTTTNNTTYADKRNVASEGAVAVSGDGNTIVNHAVDYGSVQAAITMAGNVSTKALDQTTAGLAGVLDLMKQSAASNSDMFNQTLKLIGANTDSTKEAFAKATEEVNGNRVLVGMGVIAIGLIASKGAFSK